MKKLFTISFIISIFISSCSSDDDNALNNNPILGKWGYNKITYYYENGDSEVFPLSECDRMSTLTFLSNGSIDDIHYGIRNGECVILIDEVTEEWEWEINEYLSWQQIGDQYKITMEDGTTATAEIQGNKVIITTSLIMNLPSGNTSTHITQEYIKQ